MQFVIIRSEFLRISQVYKSQLRLTADEIHISGSTNAVIQKHSNRTKVWPKCESTLDSHREKDGVGVGVEQQHSHNCKNLKRWEFFISVTLFFVKDMDKTFVFALS